MPHTNLSLPTLIHPHLDAATASIAGGLFAKVASLYVARRERNECIEDGWAELAGVEPDCVRVAILKGFAFLVRVAARARMAVR
jgi:hypothetical protein